MTTADPVALARRIAELAAAPHLLVCTDYDGTLAPIAAHPDAARIDPAARPILEALARLPETRVAVVSGRALEDLRIHSGLEPPVVLVGSHGAESPDRDPDALSPGWEARLDALGRALDGIVAPAPGAWLERKPSAIAVHVRSASREDAARVLASVRRGPATASDLRITEGKEVIELSLSRIDKGVAVTRLRDAWGTEPVVCYLGDDLTDESVFAVLRPHDVGVRVGPGPSAAAHRVESEADAIDVLALLHRLRAGTDDDPRVDR